MCSTSRSGQHQHDKYTCTNTCITTTEAAVQYTASHRTKGGGGVLYAMCDMEKNRQFIYRS